MSYSDTATRSRRHPLVPTGAAALDLLCVLVLSGLALAGFATSFTGWSFLVVGMVGALLGTVVTYVVRSLRWPLIAAVVILFVLFFLLGGPLCLRATGDTAYVPNGSTLGALAEQAIFGWKDMLTTLPPVDGDGPLLVLPWLLGMASGLVGTALAGLRTPRHWLTALLPVLGLLLVLVTVILLGVRHPQSLLAQGSVFAAVSLGWLAIRSRRASATVSGGSSGRGRFALGAALVLAASALALPASALVDNPESERTVVRTWVEPPFDIGRYPSPLAGFRKYVDLQGRTDNANVHDKPLFTVTGPPPGTRVRIATMDAYDGMVWGATNDALPGEAANDSFQRVASTIDNPAEGTEVKAEVTIAEGYSGVWLPTVGALSQIDFERGSPELKAETFRYNLATSTAVAPSGVHEGDVYSFEAVIPDDAVDADTLAAALATPSVAGLGFLKTPAVDWSKGASDPMERVLAIAQHLKSEGKYSDGVVKAEQVYLPGHNLRRLGEGFVTAQQMVGNDEQYAAVMALFAQEIGVPARVVLGAVLPESGVVTGGDVEAWVELRAADGTWRTLPTDEFMSDTPPAEQLPESNTPMSGTVVPPPAPIPPPSDAGEQSDADLKKRKADKEDEESEKSLVESVPGWLVTVGKYVGGPLLLVALLLAVVVALKALRRHRRRTHASVSARFVGGWRELIDHARDLGQPIPLGPTITRREQSRSVSSTNAATLARQADGFVFGPTAPQADAATDYWRSVQEERKAMSHAVGRRRAWLAAVSLTSFRRRPVPMAEAEEGAAPAVGRAAPESDRAGRLDRLRARMPALRGRGAEDSRGEDAQTARAPIADSEDDPR